MKEWSIQKVALELEPSIKETNQAQQKKINAKRPKNKIKHAVAWSPWALTLAARRATIPSVNKNRISNL